MDGSGLVPRDLGQGRNGYACPRNVLQSEGITSRSLRKWVSVAYMQIEDRFLKSRLVSWSI